MEPGLYTLSDLSSHPNTGVRIFRERAEGAQPQVPNGV
jgi:hypothetical protein